MLNTGQPVFKKVVDLSKWKLRMTDDGLTMSPGENVYCKTSNGGGKLWDPLSHKSDPGEKLRHGVALRASVTLVKSCKLLDQLDYSKRNFSPRV